MAKAINRANEKIYDNGIIGPFIFPSRIHLSERNLNFDYTYITVIFTFLLIDSIFHDTSKTEKSKVISGALGIKSFSCFLALMILVFFSSRHW